VLELIEERRFSFATFPVVDGEGRLLGLLPGHVVKPRYARRRVAEALTPRSQVKTLDVSELHPDPIARADRFFTLRFPFSLELDLLCVSFLGTSRRSASRRSRSSRRGSSPKHPQPSEPRLHRPTPRPSSQEQP
jgi:hypothetical protein